MTAPQPARARTELAPTWVAVIVALLLGFIIGAMLAGLIITTGRACEVRSTDGGITLVETCTRTVHP